MIALALLNNVLKKETKLLNELGSTLKYYINEDERLAKKLRNLRRINERRERLSKELQKKQNELNEFDNFDMK